jgi:hypothetical protein
MTQDKELRTKDGKIVIPEGMTIIFDEYQSGRQYVRLQG